MVGFVGDWLVLFVMCSTLFGGRLQTWLVL